MTFVSRAEREAAAARVHLTLLDAGGLPRALCADVTDRRWWLDPGYPFGIWCLDGRPDVSREGVRACSRCLELASIPREVLL